MILLTVDCDEQSNFYAVADTDELFFYRDEARNGSTGWAFGGAARQIGQGWQNIHQIICGGDGVIYAVDIDAKKNGRLLYFKDLARNGNQEWAFGGAVRVLADGGWENYTRVFSGGDGILYAIGANGDLFFMRDEARDGSIRWSFGGVAQKIGEGWSGVRDVAYGGDGIIYAAMTDGRLMWYRDLSRNGTFSWANGGRGQEIGEGWSAFSRVLSGQDGVLYGITPDGAMLFFRDLARNGMSAWADGGARRQIGSGWFVGWENTNNGGYLADTNVAGYAWPLSAGPGERVSFYVSARASYTATYLRLNVTASSLGQAVAPGFAGAATPQGTPPLPWQTGCGWNETFTLDIPVDWVPGIYSAQCVEEGGATSHITFTVKPAAQRADFAVLTCTNTLNAYNGWGGRSKYGPGLFGAATLSFQRPNPLSAPVDVAAADQKNGYGMPEFWTLNWMETRGYDADVFTEIDFESGIAWLQSYKALVLVNHPEYWTDAMRDRLDAFLAGGGNLLYLGGNGLFERCVLQEGGTSLLFFDGDPTRGRGPFYFRNADPPRPERAVLGVAFLFDVPGPPSPYRVVKGTHPFFRGTGLKDGDLFGTSGRNGGASGWEMDSSDPGTQPAGVTVAAAVGNDRGAPPANLQLLAVGTNSPDGVGSAHMVYYRHAGGGIVFSVGSLCFTGSLADDPTVQRIVANVLETCRNPLLAATLHDHLDPLRPILRAEG